MKNKIKIPKLLQRIGAVLMACFIASYSLLTAPLFNNSIVVHATGNWGNLVHDPNVSAVIDWAYNSVGSVLDRTTTALSVIPFTSKYHLENIPQGAKASLDLVYNIVRPDGFIDFAEESMQDVLNTGDWREIDVSSSSGISGAYYRNGSWHSISFFTHSGNKVKAGINYFPLLEGEDLAIYMKVFPGDGYGPEDLSITMYESVNSGTTSTFQRSFSFSPAGGCRLVFYFYSYGDWVTFDYGNCLHSQITFKFMIMDARHYGDIFDRSLFTIPTDLSSVRSYFIPSAKFSYQAVVGCSDGYAYFPYGSLISGQTSIVNSENIYKYYDKRVYNTYVQNAPTYNFNTLQYYYDQIIENPPTDPTDPTSPSEILPTQPSTGNGTVIIIDPFTLPPEWLEDNAELDTDHYVLDSEQWEDPLEVIVRYKQQISLAELGEDEDTFWQAGELSAPVSVTNAIYAFQYFGYDLLLKSGLLVVLASLVGFGIIVRFISLK